MKDTTLLIAQVVSVTTLAGALLGAWLYILGSRKQEILTELKAEHRKACEQIKAYFQQESLYADAVSKQTGRSNEDVLNDFKSKLVDAGYQRPSWSERTAHESIKKFC
jgi:hypothetical protein